MTENKRKQLEAKLKNKTEKHDQAVVNRIEPKSRFQNGNVIFIRRRKGEKDRRFGV